MEVLLGCVAGFCIGATGVGGSLLAAPALPLTAGLTYFAAGAISGSLLWKLMLGGLPGVFAAVMLATRVPAGRLRTAISAWALVLGTILAGQGLRSCLS